MRIWPPGVSTEARLPTHAELTVTESMGEATEKAFIGSLRVEDVALGAPVLFEVSVAGLEHDAALVEPVGELDAGGRLGKTRAESAS